ncbi:hypothetical protein [Chenggangzhangella methanolivorans]|uniref:Uncharacterized protein n=1 Tax=Chenggangzhangella methanolivorans TaxID=1437009 RepID=A0A9E6UM65_9HYPH|nr:hypothetical protein [Chenggangzhangella methanolivorans]QZN98863.1 hypothetical protein K6K41_18320 [Chenggangzhangella methanolivorans]
MKDFANAVRSASSTLLRSGYAIVRTGGLMKACLDETFDDADGFFARTAAEKARFSRPDILEATAPSGPNFRATPPGPI